MQNYPEGKEFILSFKYVLLKMKHITHYIIWAQREKTCLRGFAHNKDADQPSHPRSLISAIIICLYESIISRLAMSDIQYAPRLCS